MRIGITFELREDFLRYEGAPKDYFGEFATEETIIALEDAMRELGHETVRIGDIDGVLSFISSSEKVDMVFNYSEGRWGRSREAQIPSILEAYQIPYTFSDPLTLAVCLDKSFAKRIWIYANLPTPKFSVVKHIKDFREAIKTFGVFPLMVKPIHEGTSKGISEASVVTSIDELKNRIRWIITSYSQPALIEEYLPGREFTVGILKNHDKKYVLGIAEILILDQKQRIYGFTQKEFSDQLVRYERLNNDDLYKQLAHLALMAYDAIECRDAGRIDIRLDKDGKPNLLEINPIPGLHPTHSDLPIIGNLFNISYLTLIGEIIQGALDRSG